jgi:hypothetical protein
MGEEMKEFKRQSESERAFEMVSIKRYVSRAPGIKETITHAKESGWMSNHDVLRIYNIYGMKSKDIYILLWSHGISFDLEGLLMAIDSQQEELSKAIKC